jgi:enoyl-CoA hydratase
MTEQSVLVHREDDISVVTLNRPESLNSFDAAMTPALDAALSEADADPDTRAIIVTGAGRAFSAGGDVGTFGKNPDRRVNRRGWHLAQTMLRIEKPTVAMVNGAAVGLGLTVALLCDLAIAADSAKLGDTHVNLGLVAGDGAAVTLPLLIGPQKAKELLLTGRLVSGTEAAALGMVNRSVPLENLRAEAFAVARLLAGQPTYAVRATKMVINRYVRWMNNEILDVALAYEEISKSKPEHKEAVAQWKARRAR